MADKGAIFKIRPLDVDDPIKSLGSLKLCDCIGIYAYCSRGKKAAPARLDRDLRTLLFSQLPSRNTPNQERNVVTTLLLSLISGSTVSCFAVRSVRGLRLSWLLLCREWSLHPVVYHIYSCELARIQLSTATGLLFISLSISSSTATILFRRHQRQQKMVPRQRQAPSPPATMEDTSSNNSSGNLQEPFLRKNGKDGDNKSSKQAEQEAAAELSRWRHDLFNIYALVSKSIRVMCCSKEKCDSA